MALFGYAAGSGDAPLATDASLSVSPDTVKIGESAVLDYTLTVREGSAVHIRLEYGIDFVKARGQVSRKLFLICDKTVPGGARLAGLWTHAFAQLTTRRHYPGEHRIALLINGVEAAHTTVTLLPAQDQ